MADTPQQLVSNATGFASIPAGFQMSALLYLTAIRAGVTDVPTILAGAKCIDCQIPAGLQMAAVLYLLGVIADGGSGGGSGTGVTCGTADPVAAPTGTCGLFVRLDTSSLFYWDGAAWIKML